MNFVIQTNEHGKIIAYVPVANFGDELPENAVLKSEAEVDAIMAGGDAHIIDGEIVYPPASGMTLINDDWTYPEGFLEASKTRAISQIKDFATNARRKIVKFADEVKLAEYADKAALAGRLIDGTATAEEIETSVNDAWAVLNGIDDPVVIGQTWRARSHALRTARNAINLLEEQAISAIDTITDPVDIPAQLVTLKTQAEAELEQLLTKL